MAKTTEESYAFKTTFSAISEKSQEGQEEYDPATSPGSGCFSSCCFGFGRRSYHERYLLNPSQRGERTQSWVVEKFKDLKEFSEVVAGPKWKNFVRKAGKYCNPKKSGTTSAPATGTMMTSWMYSPNSYAMNFDEGPDYEEEDHFFRSFSSRFSAPLTCDQKKVQDDSPAELVVKPV